MRFYVGKRRHAPAVIIVALIDVLIVLLIFLMLTTSFQQHHIVQLAESTQSQKAGANETPPLVVSVDAKGVFRYGPDALPVTEDRLKTELLASVEKNPQLKLAISADKDAPFGQIVKVMDAAKEAKVKMINAFTKEAVKQ
jgi:biopolymer transport protein ExbD